MGQTAANFIHLVATGFADKSRQWKLALFDSYHPELHYMRGPGPKWREKHGEMTVTNSMRDLGISALWRAGA